MKKSCSSFSFLGLLSLFKGVSAEHDEAVGAFLKNIILPIVVILVTCCFFFALCPCLLAKINRNSRQKHQALVMRESTEGEHIPRYSEALGQRSLSSASQRPASNLEVLQIVNLQSTSCPQVHGAVFAPADTGEHQIQRGDPCEILIEELPPPYSRGEPPPAYPEEQPPPPYSGEQPPLPYSGEQSLQPYSSPEASPPYSREEIPPPFPENEGKSLPPYAVTTMV